MRKNIFLFTLALGLIALSGCNGEIDKVYISENPTGPELLGPASPGGLAFVKADAENLITFDWSAADYGFDASITYTVQMSLTEDFASPATLVSNQGLTGTAVVGDINSILIARGLAIGVETTVYCRVISSVAAVLEPMVSTGLSYAVTPYEALPDFPMLYVPGEYQGWAPGDVNGRIYSYGSNNIYEGIVRFVDTDASGTVAFKITSDPDWDHTNWGGTITDGEGVLDPTGGDYTIAPGVYKITVDKDALTIKLVKTEDWGIIGSAIPPYDWSVDIDMFYNGQRKMWEITGDFLGAEFKFRADDAWAVNFGDTGGDGSLEQDGSNIPLAADGNYTIRLDAVEKTYKILLN